MSCRTHFEAFRAVALDTRAAGRCTHPDRTCTFNGVPMCRPCFDAFRDEYDRKWKAHRFQCRVCPDCTLEAVAEYLRSQRLDTIDPDQPWGQHIALRCVNHPHLRWHTKNISYIGARSIFYAGNPYDGSECQCPGRDLEVVPAGDREGDDA